MTVKDKVLEHFKQHSDKWFSSVSLYHSLETVSLGYCSFLIDRFYHHEKLLIRRRRVDNSKGFEYKINLVRLKEIEEKVETNASIPFVRYGFWGI